MSVRNISFASGEYYHLYNRGNSKQPIFLDVQDYHYFLKLLFVANSQKSLSHFSRIAYPYLYERGGLLVDIGAYCLMPNHFHLLVKMREGTTISAFMHRMGTSYSMYFNKKYKRTGGLFEAKYKATHVTDDEYFQYLFAYIHLNPAKLIDSSWKEKMSVAPEELYDYVENYEYSSYQDYLFSHSRPQSVILNKEEFPFVFTENDPRKSIRNWFLNYEVI